MTAHDDIRTIINTTRNNGFYYGSAFVSIELLKEVVKEWDDVEEEFKEFGGYCGY